MNNTTKEVKLTFGTKVSSEEALIQEIDALKYVITLMIGCMSKNVRQGIYYQLTESKSPVAHNLCCSIAEMLDLADEAEILNDRDPRQIK